MCPYKLADIASKNRREILSLNERNSILIKEKKSNQGSSIERWTEVLEQEVVVQKHGVFNAVKDRYIFTMMILRS